MVLANQILNIHFFKEISTDKKIKEQIVDSQINQLQQQDRKAEEIYRN